MILNLVLVASIVAAAWQLRQNWINARLRDEAVLDRRVPPPAPPSVAKSQAPQPVTAAGYLDVVEKMLFSKERNPTVVIEPAPAPPPKPMPPLPVLYGVMNLLDGTTAVMGEKKGAQHQGVRPGDKVGEFTLVAVDNQEITLEWDGKTLTRPLDEMIDRSALPAPVDTSNSRPTPQQPPSSSPPAQTKKGEPAPGQDVGNNFRACQSGDTSPPGTVSNGFKKVVTPSPFGEMCRWVPQ
jgi:hypothetical protein